MKSFLLLGFLLTVSAGPPPRPQVPKLKAESLFEALQRLFGNGGKGSKQDTRAASPFDLFIKNFTKSYFGDSQEESRRRGMFAVNFEKVNELNQNRTSKDDAEFGVTEFSDMSHSELIKKFTGVLPGGPTGEKLTLSEAEVKKLTYPPKLDWAELGAFPAVRSQGACGSCYAFTAADLTLAQWAIESGKLGADLEPLSVRYIQECGGEGAHGCTGGYASLALKHLSHCAGCGVPLESCYPYNKGVVEKKQCDKPCPEKRRLKWSQLLDVSGPNELPLVASLLQWGPLLAIIDCSPVWQFYNGNGIIKSAQCGKRRSRQNHAILIVGYDFTGSTPYYLVRNSWGSGWGKKGYAKLEAGYNSCAVAESLIVGCFEKCGDKMMSSKDLLGRSNVPGASAAKTRHE